MTISSSSRRSLVNTRHDGGVVGIPPFPRFQMGPGIRRHKTAIVRGEYSTPVKSALSDGLITDAVTVLDYGCGRGHDAARLAAQGITCAGWDPVFRPDAPLVESDVVNLGFVINVIEDPAERAATLRRAWELCRNLLVVA